MVDRRYQVFISSTYTDLVEERREVMQALLELDCLPAGMELFPAANEDQWSLIQEVIGSSDYYVVIVGGRYGSTTAEGVSFTEKEYDHAVAQGIPVIGFVHGQPEAIPIGKSDTDKVLMEKLDAFRKKVMSRMVKKYTSPAELGSAVSRAVTQLIRKHPRAGWIRGDQAMTPETRAELAELRAALAAYEVEAVKDARGHKLDLRYAHGDENAQLRFEYWGGPSYDRKGVVGEFDYSWDILIETLGPFMIDEASEVKLREMLEEHILNDIVNSDSWTTMSYGEVSISDAAWSGVIVQLRALGVIEVGTKKRGVADKAVYWKLTPAGDDYLVGLRAIPTGFIGDD